MGIYPCPSLWHRQKLHRKGAMSATVGEEDLWFEFTDPSRPLRLCGFSRTRDCVPMTRGGRPLFADGNSRGRSRDVAPFGVVD